MRFAFKVVCRNLGIALLTP
nr:hypothetical protein [Vibrio parahaemolyticus]